MNQTNALARMQSAGMPAPETWRTMFQMAEAFVKSGLMPAHIKTPEAAVAVMQKGAELGIPPMHAMSNIIVIQGKPTANAELMAALIYRDHGDDALRFVDSTPEGCTIAYKRRSWAQYSQHTFTIADARTAGLQGGNWQKYPAAMLRARCISAVARMAFPDTIGGMYTPDELGAAVVVDADGSVTYDARETLQPSPEPPRQIEEATVDTSGRVVTGDGEIVGQLQRHGDEPDPVLFPEFERRLANADDLEALKTVGEWAARVGLTQPAVVAAFKARRKELRAATQTGDMEQPELIEV